MPKELRRITYDELAANLQGVFDRLLADREAVVVEQEGKGVAVLTPLLQRSTRLRRKPTAAEALRSKEGILKAAGGWKDLVDAEAFKSYVYKRRRTSNRPPVRL